MNKWTRQFWDEHGSKMVFGGLALILACGMHYLFDMKEEAKFVYISLTGFCLKYIRGGNFNGKTDDGGESKGPNNATSTKT